MKFFYRQLSGVRNKKEPFGERLTICWWETWGPGDPWFVLKLWS